jgi:hypothetical protein
MRSPTHPQAGSALVEFALSLTVFFMSMIAVIEFARFMLVVNTAVEASRLASRLASVCDTGAVQQARIRERVRYFVEASGQIVVGTRSDWLVFTYSPANCTPANCTLVEASLSSLQAQLLIPVSAITLPLPAYRSAQVREAMSNVIAGELNSSCS